MCYLAYQQAQSTAGIYPPQAISIGDLFMGALIPGLILVVLYGIYVAIQLHYVHRSTTL